MTNIQFQRGAIDAGGSVSNGWNLLKSNYWIFFGMTAIFALVSVVLSCIPLVPILFQIFVAPPITIGIFYALLREMERQPIDFGMMFKGFEKYGQALVLGLITAIPSIVVMILNFALNLGSFAAQILQGMKGGRDYSYSSNLVDSGNAAPLLAGGMLIVILIVAGVFLLFSIGWGITFFFAMPIMADHDISAMDAIKLSASAGWSNVGGIILLVIIEFFLALAGVVALCFGVLFVLPVIYAANAVAYRQVFPYIDRNLNMAPPPPNAYGSNFGSGM